MKTDRQHGYGLARSPDEWFALSGGPNASQRADFIRRNRQRESDRQLLLPEMPEGGRKLVTELPYGDKTATQVNLFG